MPWFVRKIQMVHWRHLKLRQESVLTVTLLQSLLIAGLLERNPENISYYSGIEKCMNIDSIEDRLKIYSDVLEQSPRSSVAKKLPLSFVTGL